MDRIEILGIPIDCITQEEAPKRIESFLCSKGQFHIATPNPEMIVEARKNGKFRTVLCQTALNLPDGTGLVWAMGKHGRGRVTGTDTLLALCKKTTAPVFFLGAEEGVAKKAAQELRRIHPALNVVGTCAGSPHPKDEHDILNRINEARPTLLFVAYGAPAQDLWIARNLPRLPSVKVAMGVGGALDFIAGKRTRAPRAMRNAGLEWAWRLIQEPSRIGRIWKAVVVFPWLVMRPFRRSVAPG